MVGMWGNCRVYYPLLGCHWMDTKHIFSNRKTIKNDYIRESTACGFDVLERWFWFDDGMFQATIRKLLCGNGWAIIVSYDQVNGGGGQIFRWKVISLWVHFLLVTKGALAVWPHSPREFSLQANCVGVKEPLKVNATAHQPQCNRSHALASGTQDEHQFRSLVPHHIITSVMIRLEINENAVIAELIKIYVAVIFWSFVFHSVGPKEIRHEIVHECSLASSSIAAMQWWCWCWVPFTVQMMPTHNLYVHFYAFRLIDWCRS